MFGVNMEECSFGCVVALWRRWFNGWKKGKRFVDETMLAASSIACHTVSTKMYKCNSDN